MNQINLESKILQKIHDDKIKPKSFWYFFIKDFSLWGAVVLSIIFTSLSLAPIIFIFENLEIGFVKHLDQSPTNFYIHIIPYPFILFAIFFILIARFSWAKTKNGYKFEGKKVFAVSAIISLIFAILLNNFAVGKLLDDNFHDPVFDSYKSLHDRRMENWNRPDLGRYIGIVNNISTSSFTLSQKDIEYVIDFDNETPGMELIEVGESVRVVATIDEEQTIDACIILPYDQPSIHQKVRKIDSLKYVSRMKKQMKDECKQVIEMGRANFLKQKNI